MVLWLIIFIFFSFHRVCHANSSIVKPVNKNQETAQRELEEAMKKVKEAQSLILAAVEPGE